MVAVTRLSDGTVLRKETYLEMRGDDGLSYFIEKSIHADGTIDEIWKNHLDIAVLIRKYDAFSRVIQEKRVQIDFMGRVASTVETPIHPDTGEVCGEKVCCEFIYDRLGNCVQELRGAGSVSPFQLNFVYDAFSRKIEEKKPSGITLFYTYDERGRLKSQTSSDGTIHYLFCYNDLNLPITATDLIHGETTIRSYSGHGVLLRETFADGQEIRYAYDVVDRLTSISNPLFGVVRHQYQDGFLKSVSYRDHQVSYEKRSAVGSSLLYTINGSFEVSTDYDISLRQKSRMAKAPTGATIYAEERLEFTIQGAVARSLFTLCHESTPREETYQYDALGQIQSDFQHRYSFDSLQRSLKFKNVARSFNTLHQVENGAKRYDADGRVVVDHRGCSYRYDALDRLIHMEKDKASVEYRYDAFHRRTARKHFENGKLTLSERFIFQGDNEIGSYSPDGKLLSFRVLGDGLGAEIGSTLMIVDAKGSVHYVVSDLSGHIRALWNPLSKRVSDWIDYTAFGISDRSSSQITPWTFA
ncbi:MAG: hypothetical protein QRY74_05345 [Chlamydia sp.]